MHFLGQKKLGKIATPDPWKSGARNTAGINKSSIFILGQFNFNHRYLKCLKFSCVFMNNLVLEFCAVEIVQLPGKLKWIFTQSLKYSCNL